MFLFSCFTGICYADMTSLIYDRIEQDAQGEWWICDNRQKTETRYVVKLLSYALFILNKYRGLTGDGGPLREFLYVDDLADLCVFLMNNYSGNETVNAGTGKELSIRELTELVAKTVGYEGEIRWDPSKPNGTPRKLLDVSKAAALGWTYKTELEEGIRLSYRDFLENPMRAER